MTRDKYKPLANIDWTTVYIYLFLVVVGWISIYAAVFNEEHHSILDITQNYGKQLLFISTALILAWVILMLDAKMFSAFSYLIYLIVLGLLLIILFKGVVIAGSKSWFQIGSFALQPAEFAKVATALTLARYMSSADFNPHKNNAWLIAFLIIGIPAAFILLQNDTGSALVFFAFLIVFFREGFSPRLIIAGGAIGLLFIATLYLGEVPMVIISVVVAAGSLLFINRVMKNFLRVASLLVVAIGMILAIEFAFDNLLQPHQKSRINVLLGKDVDLKGEGYNVHQSKIAIGSGGFSGKGFLQGTQTKYSFVPEQSTDFIFCTIGEEWGFLGSAILVILYSTLLVKIINMAERQRSQFSRIYGYSVASVLFFHFFINIGMTLGIMPVIGIPLPFISYGGSSLWAFTIMLFVFIKLDANRLSLV